MNKRLFLILREEQLAGEAANRMIAACKLHDISCIPILIEQELPSISPPPSKNDAFLVRTKHSAAKNHMNYFFSAGCKNIFLDFYKDLHDDEYSIIETLKQAGLPTIPQIRGALYERNVLKDVEKTFGGFPLVIKVTGSQTGRNVMRVDSWESLLSVSSFLYHNIEPHKVIYQQYIPHDRQGRLVVFGDKVIASIEFQKNDSDFRLNTGVHKKVAVTYPKEIQQMAVKATHATGTIFGGVDIMFSHDGRHYIAEVNTPCAFARTQDVTGIDINQIILKHFFDLS